MPTTTTSRASTSLFELHDISQQQPQQQRFTPSNAQLSQSGLPDRSMTSMAFTPGQQQQQGDGTMMSELDLLPVAHIPSAASVKDSAIGQAGSSFPSSPPQGFRAVSITEPPANLAPAATPSLYPRSPAPSFKTVNSNNLHNFLAQVANNASIMMSIPEVWTVQRPEDTPTYADYNETFRLYFGLNVTIMPYAIALGGYAGALICLVPIVILLQESIASQLRAKVVVLTNIYKDFDKHDAIDTYIHLVDALWSQRRVEERLTEVPRSDGFTDIQRQQHVTLEVVSVFPRVIRGLIMMTQFTGACSFTMLMTDNLQPLSGLELRPCLAVSCAILTVLSTLYMPETCKYFAYVSNTALIAAVVMFLVGLGMADRDEGPRWTFMRTTDDFFLLLPFVTGALSASLFAIDIEGSVSSRVIARTKHREESEIEHREQQQQQQLDELNAHRQQQQQQSMSDTPTESGGSLAAAAVSSSLSSPPPMAPLALPPPRAAHLCGPALPYANALPDTHLPTLGRTIFLLNRFERLSFIAFGIALVIHIGFGEATFAHFGSSTSSALALTLPTSSLRTALLAVLTVGSGVGAAYLISAIGTVMDELNFSKKWFGFTEDTCGYPVIRRVEALLLRSILFCAVFGVLIVVPFFDVLTSLSGSLGFVNISLVVPAIMDLQASRRKLQSEEEEDLLLLEQNDMEEGAHDAEVDCTPPPTVIATAAGRRSSYVVEENNTVNNIAAPTTTSSLSTSQRRRKMVVPEVSWWRAFQAVRLRVQVAVVAMAVCGVFISISGTVVAIKTAVKRQE